MNSSWLGDYTTSRQFAAKSFGYGGESSGTALLPGVDSGGGLSEYVTYLRPVLQEYLNTPVSRIGRRGMFRMQDDDKDHMNRIRHISEVRCAFLFGICLCSGELV